MKLEKRTVFGWPASGAGSAHPTKGVVVHYDGSNQGLANKKHTACQAYWRDTRKFHMGPSRGWADIGYSYAVCGHGIVLEGRGLNRVQAAQPGGNSTWYSVTFMSGPDENPTAAQLSAFAELRSWLRSKGVGAAIRGHRDFVSTSCPGTRLYTMVRGGTLASGPTNAREDDVPAKEVWEHQIAVPDYGQEEHPGVKTISAGGLLRGAEIKTHDTRARVTALQSEMAAVRSEVKGARADIAELRALLVGALPPTTE